MSSGRHARRWALTSDGDGGMVFGLLAAGATLAAGLVLVVAGWIWRH